MRTNTNEFGTEAIVVGNTVTSLSGADSLIPANGFVISGHGQAKKWINENIMIGSKIYLDIENKIITSYVIGEQVKRNGGKLRRGTTLEEENLVQCVQQERILIKKEVKSVRNVQMDLHQIIC